MSPYCHFTHSSVSPVQCPGVIIGDIEIEFLRLRRGPARRPEKLLVLQRANLIHAGYAWWRHFHLGTLPLILGNDERPSSSLSTFSRPSHDDSNETHDHHFYTLTCMIRPETTTTATWP